MEAMSNEMSNIVNKMNKVTECDYGGGYNTNSLAYIIDLNFFQ